jgi:hypothetical protein
VAETVTMGLSELDAVVRRCIETSGGTSMSFQAYLDAVETKTGKTPREIVDQAKARGLDGESIKAGEILAWLKEDYDLGRGHGMALVHVIKHGPQIATKHVGSSGAHRDDSDMLWLDGMATKPR